MRGNAKRLKCSAPIHNKVAVQIHLRHIVYLFLSHVHRNRDVRLNFAACQRLRCKVERIFRLSKIDGGAQNIGGDIEPAILVLLHLLHQPCAPVRVIVEANESLQHRSSRIVSADQGIERVKGIAFQRSFQFDAINVDILLNVFSAAIPIGKSKIRKRRIVLFLHFVKVCERVPRTS